MAHSCIERHALKKTIIFVYQNCVNWPCPFVDYDECIKNTIFEVLSYKYFATCFFNRVWHISVLLARVVSPWLPKRPNHRSHYKYDQSNLDKIYVDLLCNRALLHLNLGEVSDYVINL